jgi:protein-S-isoprenylcysteine O-methyltransferase Ste14
MGTRATVALYVVLIVAVIVAVDFLFFRNRFWEWLAVNIGIVLVFAAFYLREIGSKEEPDATHTVQI